MGIHRSDLHAALAICPFTVSETAANALSTLRLSQLISSFAKEDRAASAVQRIIEVCLQSVYLPCPKGILLTRVSDTLVFLLSSSLSSRPEEQRAALCSTLHPLRWFWAAEAQRQLEGTGESVFGECRVTSSEAFEAEGKRRRTELLEGVRGCCDGGSGSALAPSLLDGVRISAFFEHLLPSSDRAAPVCVRVWGSYGLTLRESQEWANVSEEEKRALERVLLLLDDFFLCDSNGECLLLHKRDFVEDTECLYLKGVASLTRWLKLLLVLCLLYFPPESSHDSLSLSICV